MKGQKIPRISAVTLDFKAKTMEGRRNEGGKKCKSRPGLQIDTGKEVPPIRNLGRRVGKIPFAGWRAKNERGRQEKSPGGKG